MRRSLFLLPSPLLRHHIIFMFNCDGFLAFWLEAVTRVWLSWAAPLQRKTGKYYPHVQTSERAACFKTKNVQVVAAADSESKETKSRGNRTNVLRSSPPERLLLMLLSTHGHIHTCVCVCVFTIVFSRLSKRAMRHTLLF